MWRPARHPGWGPLHTHSLSVPACSFQVEVEPSQEDLVGWQSQELLQSLSIFEESVELGVQLDVDLVEEASSDDLPDQAEHEVLPSFDEIGGPDVDDAAADSFGRRDDNVVVLCHLEVVERFRPTTGLRGLWLRWDPAVRLASRLVEYSLVDGVRDGVIDELAQDQTVCGLRIARESDGPTQDAVKVRPKLPTHLASRQIAASCR